MSYAILRAWAVRRAHAFTLIELLVVIAIIAIVAAILFPVFAQARDKARATTALSNAKQIALGLQMYVQDYDEEFPLTSHGTQPFSWVRAFQPYVKSLQVKRSPNDKSTNWETYEGEPGKRQTSYVVNLYTTGGSHNVGGSTGLASVNRPASCIFIGEYADNRTDEHAHTMCWEPYGCTHGETTHIVSSDTEIAKKRYSEGAHYVFVDGHAKWHRFEQTYNPGTKRNWWLPNPGVEAAVGRPTDWND